jgi:ubiquinone/menaquinone biosynthesis C-methylase UbiE
MKTEWDYSDLAEAYVSRPNYSEGAIDALMAITNSRDGDTVCDIGAGVGHLSLMLEKRGVVVTAVEPNNSMRSIGKERTSLRTRIQWFEGTGEYSGQPSKAFDLVTFGSSFNVCNRQQALRETSRILKPGGWFACLWNHRDLSDDLQSRIEQIIGKYIPNYSYGSRRENQFETIKSSGLFYDSIHVDSQIVHEQSTIEVVNAWRSHATLQRQAGHQFPNIINEISDLLSKIGSDTCLIPYTTNIWVAQLK